MMNINFGNEFSKEIEKLPLSNNTLSIYLHYVDNEKQYFSVILFMELSKLNISLQGHKQWLV